MREVLYSLLALLHKEVLMIFKDRRGRIILVMPILAQTLLFGYVATYDLNRVEYALLDEDHSLASRALAGHFDGSGIFVRVATLRNNQDVAPMLDGKKALLVLHIGPQFERGLAVGNNVPVQVLVDGRNSNVAGTAAAYASSIIDKFNESMLGERGFSSTAAVEVSSRAWFNPNLETRWNIIAGLMAILSVVQAMTLAAQAIAREKEQGTFDQLLVTPLGPMTIMTGKALPPALVGIGQSSLVLLVALYWFSIPFAGSFALLYAGLIVFNLAIVGMGLCVSALTSTMQQAMLYSFTLLMPMILLSGFISPISSMPEVLQWLTLANPVRYGVEVVQRIYLEGAGLSQIWPLLGSLALIAAVTLGTASRLFRTHLV